LTSPCAYAAVRVAPYLTTSQDSIHLRFGLFLFSLNPRSAQAALAFLSSRWLLRTATNETAAIERATDVELQPMTADIQCFYAVHENVGSGYTCCAQSGVDSMTDYACVSRQTPCGIAPSILLIIANISTSTFRSNASLGVISSTSTKEPPISRASSSAAARQVQPH
jgi:hypothetical protein